MTFQAGRVRAVVADGVKEIWLSSEDTGAYGMSSILYMLVTWLIG